MDLDEPMPGLATDSQAISAVGFLEDYLKSYQAAGHVAAVLLR
jgi:hypothetical protein